MKKYIFEELQLVKEAFKCLWMYALWLVLVVSGVWVGLPFFMLLPLALGFAVLSVVDIRHFILPDILTLPGILLGIICAPLFLGGAWQDSLLGVAVGGGFFILLSVLFYKVRGKHGMGFGDIKLLALIGAWAGVLALLPTLLIASLCALLFLPLRLFWQGEKMDAPFPFGPFLIVGGWLSLLWGHIFWQLLLGRGL